MLSFAFKSLSQLFTPPFRMVLAKSLGLTLALFIAAWFGSQSVLSMFTIGPYPWVDTMVAILAGVGLVIGMVFIIGPITALFAGLFLDEIAQTVEAAYYPEDAPGIEVPILQSLVIAVKFTVVVILVNIGVLLLAFFPGVNILAFVFGNGYLLGREYFEMVGLRHMSHEHVKALRHQNRGTVLFAGVMIASLAAIPFVNLLTPLFATALMVHVFKSVAPSTGLTPLERQI